MGYTTQFEGELKFATELTASQLAEVKSFCNEDCRDHPEWIGASGLYYMDIELLEDFSGIRWDGTEKTYEMEKLINVLILNMRDKWPEFGLTGKLAAQGEDIEDRWELVIGDDGLACRRDLVVAGERIECPHCGGVYLYEASHD